MNRTFLLSIAALAFAAGTAEAGNIDVRIDLSTLVTTTGGTWNDISDIGGLTTGLIDYNTGLATGVSIDGTGSPWQHFFGDDNNAFGSPDRVLQSSVVDGAGLGANETGVYTFSGLTGTGWRLEVVAARTTFDYLNTITAAGALADRTENGTPVVTPWRSASDGLAQSNWLIWDNVSLVGGSFSLIDVAGPQTLGMINAIRLTQTEVVPLPSSALMGLGLLGGIGVTLRFRKRPTAMKP